VMPFCVKAGYGCTKDGRPMLANPEKEEFDD